MRRRVTRRLLGVSPGSKLCAMFLNIAKYFKTVRCCCGAVAFIFSIYLKPVLYFIQLQTGWIQDQGPQRWILIFAPASLSPALHSLEKILQKVNFIIEDVFFYGSHFVSHAARVKKAVFIQRHAVSRICVCHFPSPHAEYRNCSYFIVKTTCLIMETTCYRYPILLKIFKC